MARNNPLRLLSLDGDVPRGGISGGGLAGANLAARELGIGAATLPFAGVNLAAGLFGRSFSFLSHARSIRGEGGGVLKRQIRMIKKAGGKGTDIFGRLTAARTQLNKASEEDIVRMGKGLLSLTTEAQRMIDPKIIPGVFRPPFKANQRKPQNQFYHNITKPFLVLRTNLDRLEGKGKDRIVFRGKGRGKTSFNIGPAAATLDLNAIWRSLGIGGIQQPLQTKQKGIDKKQVGRLAMNSARRFLRFPTQQPREFQPMGFTSKARAGTGLRDVSELEQFADRIVPSGFTSKLATRDLGRSNALNRFT